MRVFASPFSPTVVLSWCTRIVHFAEACPFGVPWGFKLVRNNGWVRNIWSTGVYCRDIGVWVYRNIEGTRTVST